MKFNFAAHYLCAVSLCALSTIASAQEVNPGTAQANSEPAQIIAEPQAPKDLVLNAGTPITLAVTEEVNSSTHKEGDEFRLTVLNDVTVGQTVVIPRGTPATAEITWRTGKGAFGKSGKMEFELRSIYLDGTQVPLSGSFRQEGEGNTVATGVGVIAIGVFAGFITGKRARLPVGRELMAQVAQNVAFGADGKLSPRYDAAAAMKLADASTPFRRCRASAKGLGDAKLEQAALKKCFAERME
ncbi:hypothetical protein [Sphingorhabdus contaminans]|uniref:Protein BatD n=1 Tax=Sphingorhabdus contaminans TaxID=1343899 RepID=A0A553WJM8_9SPHN|nr:hypothetical protein [Sphingorhabdus contaminans]TSB04935.1 hypothetical protein FOM92_05960 [Sphingorhabdus contaminans]